MKRMSKGVFSRGYDAVHEKKAKVESRHGLIYELSVKEDEEAQIHFLTTEPVSYYVHELNAGTRQFKRVICTQDDDCPYCDEGISVKYLGAFLVWDYRAYEYTDSAGKEHSGEGQLRLYTPTPKVLTQIEALATKKKYGLNRDYTLERIGSGTKTQYSFQREDIVEFDEDEIREMLPEMYQEVYDGTEESLYEIVEDQLLKRMEGNGKANEDDEEEKKSSRKGKVKNDKRFVSVEDDEDDEEEDGDDEEEDLRDKKKPFNKSRETKKSSKPSAKGFMKKR